MNNRILIPVLIFPLVVALIVGLFFVFRADDNVEPKDPDATDNGTIVDPEDIQHTTGNPVIEFDEGNEAYLDESIVSYLERMDQGVPSIDENGNYYLYEDGDVVYDYESATPGSYKGYSAPASSTEKATWTMWVYENNQFVLKSYGVQISSAAPVITPSADCKTAIYANGKWTIRSGYGFTISFSPTVITVSGYNNPGSSAYTSVQSVYATFPEFNYETTNGNCRTLRLVNGKWQFVQNSNAADNGRIHFIPVWFADGDYTVSVTASRVWTPAGIISATRTSNTINIDGSIFDDYYVGN